MSHIPEKLANQPIFKVLGFFIFTMVVIAYNYSLLSATLYFGESYRYAYVSVDDAALNDFNDDLRKHGGFISGYNITDLPPPGYLVWSNHCRMPDVNPFTADAMKLFKKNNYTPCIDAPQLTKLVFDINARSYSLFIDEDAKQKLVENNDNVTCCYQSVWRAGKGQRVDKDFKLDECVIFNSSYIMPNNVDSVIVTCKSIKHKLEIQKDAYFLVREKTQVIERQKKFEQKGDRARPASVILLGIDSMSRFNLRRVMPKTAAKFQNDGWFELSGYNKVADNTLPNLMALLTGFNMTTNRARCNLKEPGGLDNCNMIWGPFRHSGYTTAYAEDETWMSTFDFVVKGFKTPPVDYYHRPFQMAIENTLKIKKRSGLKYCVGLRHGAEYVYDFALEFATRFRSKPYFGLFWANTFSHNAFDDANTMDSRIYEYIKEMRERGILDESIVIFFSDHGMRFGSLRRLKQGYLEERLPFIFIWLPLWFRLKYPQYEEALKVNRYRLTNPYDIHMTLKHILELSGQVSKFPPAGDCPKCQSVFIPVPKERSCKDIAIDDHWCTCVPYANVGTKEKEVINAAGAVLKNLNTYLKNGGFSPPCIALELKEVEEAQIRINLESYNNQTKTFTNTYRIRFTIKNTKNARFEASVVHLKTLNTYDINGSVSRLDSYEASSKCISENSAKKYCICK